MIYPPISTDWWKNRKEDKEKILTTIGRFSDDKRQLEQIQIAENLEGIHFNIIGFIGNKSSYAYFKKCENYVKTTGITNVSLYPNLSSLETKRKIHKSQFFMHNMRNEPIGISTTEAIAAGCIPIVHNSGGQKEIVSFDSLRFNDKFYAIQNLKNLKEEIMN